METVIFIVLKSVLAGVGWGYYLLPHFFRRNLARAIGFLFYCAGHRADVIRGNLKIAFPGEDLKTVELRAKLFRQFYDHLAQVILEIFLVFGPMRRFVDKFCQVKGVENWTAAKKLGKGVLLLSSHVGNWEVMSAIGTCYFGMDLLLVTKKVKPSWFHRLLENARLSYGVKGTYEPKTMRDIILQIKQGNAVGIVLDQYAGPPVGVRVPFFDYPAGTTTALAALAKRTGAPVLPVLIYRDESGAWVGEIEPPLEWVPNENLTRELAENTAMYVKKIEQHVRACPNQWLWSHRRFKGNLSPISPEEWSEGRVRA
ncbi:MAG: lysophospholipid acyltransferase family protein [Bdellovibrionota bacterium]